MSESDSMFPGLEATVAPPPQAAVAAPPGRARLKPVDRRQMMMRPVDVERLIEEDHPARAIGDFVGQLDLSAYQKPIAAVEGVAGRPVWAARLLISLWIYAYSRGIGSAREISRRLAYEPAFQWLAGLAVINYHTLSDFRVAFEQPLNELFANSLGVMSAEGLVSLERVEQNLEKTPEQLVTDGGFTNRQNLLECADKGIDFIGSFPEPQEPSEGQLKRRGVTPEFYVPAFPYDAQQDCYRCPAGALLRHTGQENRPGVIQHQYRAEASVCAQCRFKEHCCPQNASKGRSITRAVEAAPVQEFKQKMQTPEAKAIYRQRGAVAEFPKAWIKEKLGLRQFHVRGLLKVGLETLWVCLTYNIQQWIRLVWRARQMASVQLDRQNK